MTIDPSEEQCLVYLMFESETLDRNAISCSLQLTPSLAWNPREPHYLRHGVPVSQRVLSFGRWVLNIPGSGLRWDDALMAALTSGNVSPEVWRPLSARWEGRVSLVGRAREWTRQFTVSNTVIAALAERGLELSMEACFDPFVTGVD